jgi:hypothetical protein
METPPATESTESTAIATSEEIRLTPEDPIAPRWAVRFAHFARLGLALALILSALLGLTSCASAPSANWQSATQSLKPEEVKAIATAISDSPIADDQLSAIQAWKIPTPDGKRNPVLLSFSQLPQFCGSRGCLYVAIDLSAPAGSQVAFNAYLNPALPKGYSLVQVATQQPDAPSPYPCLTINQVESAQQLRQSRLCFNGQKYSVVDGTVLSLAK